MTVGDLIRQLSQWPADSRVAFQELFTSLGRYPVVFYRLIDKGNEETGPVCTFEWNFHYGKPLQD